jgi:hypothetical protein
MKLRFGILVFSIFLISCSHEEKRFNSLEFMAYNWSRFNDTTRTDCASFLKCKMYAVITEDGTGQIYKYSGYPNPHCLFCSLKIDKNLINAILLSDSLIDSNKLNVFDSVPLIYDGPLLKLRINYLNNNYKLFDFIDLQYGNQVDNLRKLPYYIDSLLFLNKSTSINDSANFDLSRLKFVSFVIDYDTTHYPKVPPPSKEDQISK